MTNTTNLTLTDRTKLLLANFAMISPSIYLHKGNVIRTIDSTGGIIAKATIDEVLPFDFPVANLKGLLSTINLSTFKNSTMNFTEEKLTIIAGATSVDYFASDEDAVESIEDDIEPESVEFTFDIDAETLKDFGKAAKGLGLPFVNITASGGKVVMKAYNPDLPASTSYKLTIADKSECVDFEVNLKVANMSTVIEGNYTVKVCVEDGYNVFTAIDGMLEYIVGHEESL